MTKQHKSTPEQWAYAEACAPEDFAGYACILELRGRIEALEAAQQPPQDKLDRLIAIDRDDSTEAAAQRGQPMTTDYRALCAELLQLEQEQPVEYTDWKRRYNAAIARTRAALAQPEPSELMDNKLMDIACATDLVYYVGEGCGFASRYMEETDITAGVLAFARAAIAADRARWGTPALQPMPVSERLPGPEELATLVPLMHSGASLCHSEGFYEESDAIGRIADLLEQLMPQSVAEGPTIPSHYGGHEIAVYRDGFHAGYKEALARSANALPTPEATNV